MERIERSVDVEVPVEAAYHQWSQFEEFPRFMVGVESVKRLDPHRLHWVARIGEQRKEWIARITQMIPPQCIAWRTEGSNVNAGRVTFYPVEPHRTRIMVYLEYEPAGVLEAIGDQLGLVSRRVEVDLLSFKDFIEARAREGGERVSSLKLSL
jgi:uncharacterized membrane protein